MRKEDMLNKDVRGKLILETARAVAETFNRDPSIATIITGLALQELGYRETKEVLAYLQGIKKTPVSQRAVKQQEIAYYLERKNESGN